MTGNDGLRMKILAFEFSAELRSVAIRIDDAEPVQVQETCPRERGPLAMVEDVLRRAGLEREQVECLAVGLGPGSYTGVRAAIALAQGWQLALGTPILGISSVEALAVMGRARGLGGEVAVVVDAQRGEFYMERYRIEPTAHAVQESLRLVDRPTVMGLVEAGGLVIGADAASEAVGATRWLPEAGAVARLATGRTEFVAGETLEPIYLRESGFVKAPPPRRIPEVKE
jgi:tRNA threonylcarbamoyladenosine biosynthesis protein TsaB